MRSRTASLVEKCFFRLSTRLTVAGVTPQSLATSAMVGRVRKVTGLYWNGSEFIGRKPLPRHPSPAEQNESTRQNPDKRRLRHRTQWKPQKTAQRRAAA